MLESAPRSNGRAGDRDVDEVSIPSGAGALRSAPPSSASHTVVITPPRRWPLPNLGRLWESREVLLRFAQRDVTLRYRQTFLGVVWVVLQPLLGALVLTFVFHGVAKLSTSGVPAFAFTFPAMMAWNAFNAVLARGSGSLVANQTLVSKVFFPRMLVPLSTCGSALVDLSVSLVFMVGVCFYYHIVPGIAVLLLPIWILLVFLLAGGAALVCAALMVNYRDIQYVVPFLLGILVFASPIAYAIPSHHKIFYLVNPLSWLFEAIRWSLLNTPPPSAVLLALAVSVPVFALIVGALIFEHLERGFADYI